jgi:integrase
VGNRKFKNQIREIFSMAKMKRYPTNYPGVFYIMGEAVASGKPEKIFYIRYRKDGKQIEEKAGRQYQDDMTPAKASFLRGKRISGDKSNQERRAEQEAVKAAEKGKWTINKLWDAYLDGRHLKGVVTDKNRYENHLKPIFGDREPSEIIPLDVDRIRIKMLKTAKPATVRNTLELLRRIVNYGTRKNLCEGLNFKITFPKVDNEKTEDLTPEQLKALWGAIGKDTNLQAANLMRMALYTGMRRGELFKLRWSDVDFERNFIHIRDPKGGKSEKIPLNESARQLLIDHVKTGSDFVFPGRGGKQRVDIKKPVNRIKKRAGLPKSFRALHGLRHVYASMLASSGQVDMYTLQKLLTHKSPTMTQRYAHLRDDSMRKASNLAGDIINGSLNGNGIEIKKK